jgi:hypothetical protein
MLLLFAFAAVTFHTDFEGANLGRVEPAGADRYRCHLKGQTDQDGRNRQANWYYFRIDGAKGRALTLDLVDLPGEYNYQPNRGAVTKDTLPFWSIDGKSWRPIDTFEYNESEPLLRLHITPEAGRIWIAHVPPYTNRNLADLLTDLKGNPYLDRVSAGRTVAGREIPLLTITDRSAPDRGKKVIWLMFRQHAWEAGSSWSGEGAIRYLVSNDETAGRIRRTAIVKIFPMCDPDGVANGNVRFNAYGFDLNRNWDVTDPKRMPEITAERAAIFAWLDSGHSIDIFLSLHNTETAEYLAGPPDSSGSMRPLMERLFRLLSDTSMFAASRPPQFDETSTTPGKPGRMNAPQGLYHDRKVPAFLIEQRIAKHPKLGRQPNIQDREQFGKELVQALWRATSPGPD